jgi:hypothetical protein
MFRAAEALVVVRRALAVSVRVVLAYSDVWVPERFAQVAELALAQDAIRRSSVAALS